MNHRNKPIDGPICLVQFASQPDIMFYHDNCWGIPCWGDEAYTSVKNVYLGEEAANRASKRFYTFEESNITCKHCLYKLETARKIIKEYKESNK